VPTFADREVSRGQLGGNPTVVNLGFWTGAAIFSFKYLLIYPHEVVWIPFRTHCTPENVIAPGIEPKTSGSVAN
jgi:hypothetical protein